ncbi:unnamed protein product [Mytilus edulis]|uniref:Uncharacterized protein n=1 Tax=Mytilus edulis TaxID=6550 RepID=A0A8S3U2N8_MYTED|nr:unnamed protein product [Mytilus edulis]
MKMIVAMDTNGKHLTNYHTDKDRNPLFRESINAMTSTHNGNIFAIDSFERVVVLGKTEVINIYTGDSIDDDYDYKRFSPNSLVTTSLDNVIVGHSLYSDEFHVLNNSGILLTTYDLSNAGIGYVATLAITTEGQLDVLYAGCGVSPNFYKMTIAGC